MPERHPNDYARTEFSDMVEAQALSLSDRLWQAGNREQGREQQWARQEQERDQ
ncbi:hypothetical protein OCH239_21410 [Roseivivax halodurans JCM 10272]|uniref:Uncharacterized protein n=1 Tax=Roseivivax halodurans JCM 10272 TaxID=1449350 RepID=X7E5Y8_9RHOB|nr:hypothetical protein OCH239_21410 [Roseivivax halodurans JCM 10272]